MTNDLDSDCLGLEDLLRLPQYSLEDSVKNSVLLRLIKDRLPRALTNRHISNLFSKRDVDVAGIQKLDDIPFIPVQMFKHFNLTLDSDKNISRVVMSSGTTSGRRSIIPISKETSANQMKGLTSTIENYLGRRRRVLIVIDHPRMNDPKREITARGAGIRGFSIFAKEVLYVLKESEAGDLTVDTSVIDKLQREYADKDVYVFGFTYIIWKVFCKEVEERGIRLRFADTEVFHGGGWKKLSEERVSKEEFSNIVARLLSTKPEKVHDFYGMAEQAGIVFVDCEFGHKHVPNFSQVIIRNTRTLEPCGIGEKGMIEVIGVLSHSYYSYAILTEDIGHLEGVDDCPCGRKGRYFTFDSRVERAELRGCGDTHRE